MRNDRWELFAKEDPLWYIEPGLHGNVAKIWESGEQDIEYILSGVREQLRNYHTVIDIGCGIGRHLIPMCSHFQKCIGVDISPVMLELLRKFAAERDMSHKVKVYLPTEPWYEHRADFIYSYGVFRIIEDLSVIEDYIRKIAISLVDGGFAHLQFDTRPQTLAYKVKNILPDFLVQKTWRRGVRGVRRSRGTISHMLEKHGLTVVAEDHTGSKDHRFIVLK